MTAIATTSSRTRLGFALLVGLICMIGVSKAVNTTLDPDLFWHLRVADQLTREGVHPLVDQISFASIKQPWTPYSWLAELGMKWVWNRLGYRGTILFQAMAIVGTLALIAMSCRTVAGPDRQLNAAAATVLAAYLSLPYMSFRPATFAIFWLALCAWLVLRDRRNGERTRAIWWIVPVTALLANVHLVVVMTPIWIGCLLAGAVIEGRQGEEASIAGRRRIRRYALLLLATSVACLATPMLPGLVRTAWNYQFHDVMVGSGIITEMTPIYAGLAGLVTTFALAALVAVALRHRHNVRRGEWIWLFVASLLMLRLGRFAPMFAMIAAPILAACLPRLSDVVLEKKPVLLALATVFTISFVKLAIQFPRPGASLAAFLNKDETFAYPTAAADFVQTQIAPGTARLINEFTWGGYLAWRLGDRYQIFLDGRTQLYSSDFWRSTYLCDEATRMKTLRDANADVAVLPAKKSQFHKALESFGWKTVYKDDRAEVLVPPRE